jgi:hypothetical protein
VDVPFGLRGGLPDYGDPISPRALMLATEDGHPRAISYTSWVPAPAVAAIQRHPFYFGLVSAQDGHADSAAQLTSARLDAHRLHVGWVLVWRNLPAVPGYLLNTGFRPVYRANGVTVYRATGRARPLRGTVSGVLPEDRGIELEVVLSQETATKTCSGQALALEIEGLPGTTRRG